MNAITPDFALTLKLTEAVWNAIARSKNGYPGVEIGEELAKRGLVIVDAARHDKLLATLQFVGSALESIVTDMGAQERALRGRECLDDHSELLEAARAAIAELEAFP